MKVVDCVEVLQTAILTERRQDREEHTVGFCGTGSRLFAVLMEMCLILV